MRLLLGCLLLLFASCSSGAGYTAETTIGSARIVVRLKQSHPYLAEYKRFIEVERGGRAERKEIFPDTGGYAWIAVSIVGGAVELRGIGGLEHSFSAGLQSSISRTYLGRFDFKRSPDGGRRYVFIPVAEDPGEPRMPE